MSEPAKLTEQIEKAAWADAFAAPSAEIRDALGLEANAHGETLILSSPAIDSLLFNRALGFPPEEQLRRAALDHAVDHFRERGIDRYFLQIGSEERSPALTAWTATRGLQQYELSWAEFLRDSAPPPALETELTLLAAEPRHAPAIASILTHGFDLPASAGPVFEALVGRPRWHLYVATHAGWPVAVGALFTEGELGYLAFAATAPEFRGRRAQGALMSLRLRRAAELGCRFVGTETGEPVQGKPGHSYRNMLRCGFRVVRVRDNYVPRGTTWLRRAPARDAVCA